MTGSIAAHELLVARLDDYRAAEQRFDNEPTTHRATIADLAWHTLVLTAISVDPRAIRQPSILAWIERRVEVFEKGRPA